MLFAPASFPWLLRHELRLLWRGSVLLRTRRAVLVPVALVGGLFQLVALLLAGQILHHPLAPAQMLLAANINVVFLAALMFSRAITASIDVLYARGDVDFLLASPLPPGRVLAVRILGVAFSIAAPWLLLGGVLANALAMRGQGWALAIYPMVLAEALVVAAIAFAVTVALLMRISPQAARRVGHGLALAVGVGIFILGQAPRFVSAPHLAAFWAAMLPGPHGGGLAFLFARGLLGQGGALIASLGVALAVFGAIWGGLAKSFAEGAISAAAARPRGRVRGQGGTFRASALAALCGRDMRLLLRFPGLVSQVAYRSLALVPVLMILAGKFRTGDGFVVAVPLLVFLGGQLALFFVSVLSGSDTAPDLAASAPVTAALIRRARIATAAYATVLVLAVPLLGVLARAPALLEPLLLGLAGVMLCNLILGLRLPMPLTRAAFGKVQHGTLLGLVLGLAVSSFWAFIIWLMVAPDPLIWLRPAAGG